MVDFNISVLLSVIIVLGSWVLIALVIAYSLVNKLKTLYRWWFWLGSVAILIVAMILSVMNFINAYNNIPNIAYSTPQHEGVWEDYKQGFVLNFNVPVVISRLNPQFSRPDIIGEWHYEKYLGFLPVTRKATFIPTKSLPAAERGVMYIIGMARPGFSESHEQAVNFFSHNLPQVYKTTPVNNSKEVGLNTSIQIELENKNIDLAKWSFTTTPAFEFDTLQSNNKFYLTPKAVLQQGINYTVTVSRAAGILDYASSTLTTYENPVEVASIQFTTIKSPLLQDFSGWGGKIKQAADLQITFEQEMQQFDASTQIIVSPAFKFSYIWKNNKVLIINPETDLLQDTTYNLSISNNGIKTSMGGTLENKIDLSFITVGPVRLASSIPANGDLRVSRSSQVRVVFDQEVNKQSAESLFRISPNVAGNFSWDGNALTFTPNNVFDFNTTYTVQILDGVKSIDGIDGNQVLTLAFTTIPNQTIIAGFGPASIDYQDYHFTCGIASTKMALAWKGINVSEDYIINAVGQNSSSMDVNAQGKYIWGDPNKAFLGFPNGSGTYGLGQSAYGVHWQPIINALQNSFGIATKLYRNWNAQGLAGEIAAGHPVLIFWWNGYGGGNTYLYGQQGIGGSRIDWIDSTTGETVEAIHGMHAVLAVGFNGDPSNPSSFIMLDPWEGYQTYSIDTLNYRWPKLQNTGVAIY